LNSIPSLHCYQIEHNNDYSQWQQSQCQTNELSFIFYCHVQQEAVHQICQRYDN
jgi:hypothetical protein